MSSLVLIVHRRPRKGKNFETGRPWNEFPRWSSIGRNNEKPRSSSKALKALVDLLNRCLRLSMLRIPSSNKVRIVRIFKMAVCTISSCHNNRAQPFLAPNLQIRSSFQSHFRLRPTSLIKGSSASGTAAAGGEVEANVIIIVATVDRVAPHIITTR